MTLSVLHSSLPAHCTKSGRSLICQLQVALSEIIIFLFFIMHDLIRYDITITLLHLLVNNLTRSSSSCISDLTIHCRVEELDIRGNDTIGEDPTLYSMLSHPSSKLVSLNMSGTSLSSSSAIILFTALAKGNKLQWLSINDNPITDKACDFIAITMKDNTTLVGLEISDNKISGDAAQHLLQALQHNNKLEELWLPNSYTEKTIKLLLEKVNKNRESRGCLTKLELPGGQW